MKTVSLDLSKQLKEAGYPQNGWFNWYQYKNDEPFLADQGDQGEFTGKEKFIANSPTADEILERLPVIIKTGDARGNFQLFITKQHQNELRYGVLYTKGGKGIHTDDQHITLEGRQYDEFLAEAAAKIWLYLKNNGLLPEEKV